MEVNLDFTAVSPALARKYRLVERTFQRMHADQPDVRTMRARFFERFDAAPLHARDAGTQRDRSA